MIFKNINELTVVDDFVTKYGDIIVKKHPQLENSGIIICIDTQAKGWLKDVDNDKNSPYTSNPACNVIFKHENSFNKCGFLAEEEMAMIAHELGHIIIARILKQEPEDQFQKECLADDFPIFLGLADALKSALKKMIEAKISPENNDGMQKRIDRICEMQASSQPCSPGI